MDLRKIVSDSVIFYAERRSHGPQKEQEVANRTFNDKFDKTKVARLLRSRGDTGSAQPIY
jgi:hypothetical protein